MFLLLVPVASVLTVQERTGPSLVRRRILIHGSSRTSQLLQRAYRTSSSRHHADVFPSQIQDPSAAAILSSMQSSPAVAQTMTEKLVQRYSLGLKEGQFVKSGDYVILRPHKAMTHGNIQTAGEDG